MTKKVDSLLRLLVGKRSVIILICSLALLNLLLILGSLIPQIKPYIYHDIVFKVVVLTALLQIILLLVREMLRDTPITVGSEQEEQQQIYDLIEKDSSISRIHVLSAGLRSRAAFLRSLLEKHDRLQLSIVASFGQANPDKLDREKFGPVQVEILTNRLNPHEEKRIAIRQSYNAPSLRLVILASPKGPRYAILGWYTYYDQNTKIIGRRNLQLLVDWRSQIGTETLRFAEKMFDFYSTDEESMAIFPAPIASDLTDT